MCGGRGGWVGWRGGLARRRAAEGRTRRGGQRKDEEEVGSVWGLCVLVWMDGWVWVKDEEEVGREARENGGGEGRRAAVGMEAGVRMRVR